VVEKNQSLTQIALTMAQDYREKALEQDYQLFNEDMFVDSAETSHQSQKDIEASDKVSFDQFLADYFAQ